jgi:hypothetical protein
MEDSSSKFSGMMLKNIPCRKAQEEACELRMLWHLGVHMFPKIHWEKCFQDFVRICGLDKDTPLLLEL